jgi:rhodanese-related sulfurtransferase
MFWKTLHQLNSCNHTEVFMTSIQKMITDLKGAIPNITPTPPDLKAQSTVHELKSRLEWGEPALTILDVRDRETFNDGHITGAITMPLDELLQDVQTPGITVDRDIYVYGATDEETALAASLLRQNGFCRVSELKGGLSAWKAAAGPTDGSEEQGGHLTSASYNVFAQLSHHFATQKVAFKP